ncbi:uncharacterized protein LOC117654173 isoform X2 [Thrips palmi]|uniref:Uncharacterized protein LOC117654173 isoform X2 n=1 Tax=Thrips palmi TaxID=161013 RepID=A0A6P9AG08_THRPL|nr:uncharacterized protein LOC117654173 isoform X2 [Thrips palmi]
MNTASDVFKSLVVVALAAGMLNVASGATTTPAAAAPASGTTAAANNAAMKNLKKGLDHRDGGRHADGARHVDGGDHRGGPKDPGPGPGPGGALSILRAAARGIAAAASRARTIPREGAQSRMVLYLLLPCVKDRTLTLGLLAYSTMQDAINCMMEQQYQWFASGVCMLDGTTYKNVIALVEIGMDVLRCILQCLALASKTNEERALPSRGGWSDVSVPLCNAEPVKDDVQVPEAASLVARHAKQACQVVVKELDHSS